MGYKAYMQRQLWNMCVLFIVDTEFDAPVIKTNLTELGKFNLGCVEVLGDDCFRGSVCHSYMLTLYHRRPKHARHQF